ncbi:biotin/lipoate A/B protein ligase family protein [Halovenus rubra]|uniref:Biotin/lipoate A/B protein ligase family protein n=2 Tax=Halovenus rubra TaxID=869890 RepID=A0ABD5X7A0_9EURY|nr:biotin/lipoate A/B protein ligase family protein [Halovenus rubra]
MTELADRDWRLVPVESRPGPMQMALEEVAAETAASGGPRTVRVYTWEPSTLSLGYRQPPETVDWEYCDNNDITVTRRPTGGGGIYHDSSGDISYSIVGPEDELPGDLMTCYELLCTPILDAFDRMGVDAAFADEKHPEIHKPTCYLRKVNPAHDILADGHKISGNAQYRQREAVIQHGSLSYALAPDRHLGTFRTDAVSESTFDKRVTSIREQAGIDRKEAVETLEAALTEWCDADVGEWTNDELDRAAEIADEKYTAEEWNRRRNDPLSV